MRAVLARLEKRKRDIATQAQAAREQIAQLTAQLDGLDTAADGIRLTRKTLPEVYRALTSAPTERTAQGLVRLLVDGPAVEIPADAGHQGIPGPGPADRRALTGRDPTAGSPPPGGDVDDPAVP